METRGFLVQHYDSLYLNWVTEQELGASYCFSIAYEDKEFESIKDARKHIKAVIKREKNLNTPVTVVYEEEVE